MKKCRGCGSDFEPRYSTAQIVCSPKCAHDVARTKAEKKKAKASKEARKKLRDIERKSLSWQHKQTQPAFNRMRVLEELKWFRDRGLQPTCISCGQGLGGDHWCCGHFKTVGSSPELRYDENNTFLQHNRRCNQQLSGDIEGTGKTRGYKRGLIERFGEEIGQAIIEHCEMSRGPRKWTWQELEEMRAEFRKRIKELEGNA